ncbi:MAG: class I SAM-dependent methyltransferase [Bacteroidia bacterium]|nr:class I SAM-dependent methyltransferase [Bacteroidia bacterium]
MDCKNLYLELLKNVLIGLNRIDRPLYVPATWSWENKGIPGQDQIFLSNLAEKNELTLCRKIMARMDNRVLGGDWPFEAETMIGLKRLENIEFCFNEILKNKIPGDLIETGVWRGGATIFMRALLKVNDVRDRKVWVADSFAGLPNPDPNLEADKNDTHHSLYELVVSLEEVQQNFRKYGLLDDQVLFLKGWFKDTLPLAPIERLALLRLDGDMYSSTMDVLVHLYPKLSSGGFVIIDDWGAVPACKQAVLDYRSQFGIEEEIYAIDWAGIYWTKEK